MISLWLERMVEFPGAAKGDLDMASHALSGDRGSPGNEVQVQKTSPITLGRGPITT